MALPKRKQHLQMDNPDPETAGNGKTHKSPPDPPTAKHRPKNPGPPEKTGS